MNILNPGDGGRRSAALSKLTSHGAGMLRALLFCLLINAPLVVASNAFPVHRAVFPGDLLACAAVALYLPRISLVLAFISLACKALVYSAQIYRFKSIYDLLLSFEFAPLVQVTHISSLAVFASGALVLVWIAVLLLKIKSFRFNGLHIGLSICLLLCLDSLNGSLSLGRTVERPSRTSVNVLGSATYNAISAFSQAQVESQLTAIDPVPESYRQLSIWSDRTSEVKILVFIVESLGQPAMPSLMASLAEPINNPKISERWTVSQSKELSHGTTTDGELRVLCGLKGHYSLLDSNDSRNYCVTSCAGRSASTASLPKCSREGIGGQRSA